jgi:hypothetical protein
MMAARWSIAGVLLVLFLAGAIFNLVSIIRRGRGEKFPSIVPLLPGLVGALGVRLLPIPHPAWLSWLPPVLDVGCLPLLVFGIVTTLHEHWRHSRRFLVKTLHGTHADGAAYLLKLYRHGDLLLTTTAPAYTATMGGQWQLEGEALLLTFTTHLSSRLLPTGDGSYRQAEKDGPLAGVEMREA